MITTLPPIDHDRFLYVMGKIADSLYAQLGEMKSAEMPILQIPYELMTRPMTEGDWIVTAYLIAFDPIEKVIAWLQSLGQKDELIRGVRAALEEDETPCLVQIEDEKLNGLHLYVVHLPKRIPLSPGGDA